MINYSKDFLSDDDKQLTINFDKEFILPNSKIYNGLGETQDFINNNLLSSNLWCNNYYSSGALETTKLENSIPKIKSGTSFIADSDTHESICTLCMDSYGNTKVDGAIIRDKATSNIQFIKYSTESLRAKVLEIHDKSIIAEVYYDDHESEREFNEIFKDILEEANLLEQGSLFEIVTERHRNGFSVDVRAISEDLSEEDNLLFLEIMKDRNNKC